MRFLKLALLVGGFMLLSSSAYSQEAWRLGPSIVGAATPFPLCTRGISPGSTCYWTFDGNTDTNSPVINITAEYAMLYYNAKIDATDVGNTISVYKVIGAACTGPSTSGDTSNSERIVYFDTDGSLDQVILDGVDDTNGSVPNRKLFTGCYFIDPVTLSADEDAMVMLTGAPVGRQ